MSKENARVLGRIGARQLTANEIQQVSGGSGPNTFQLTGVPPILDLIPDPVPI
ncbi:MAG TPA: hypothetical protein VHA33_24585 [Candidatus Angelobacter sp.]|jgi:hypothetical protein|nr:hypothetical protein [Candidatus Angelobacter sp.]